MGIFLPCLLLGSMMAAVTMATGYTNCKSMATFNAGLLTSIGNKTSRVPLIIEALKRSPDDFICMQEVWKEKEMAEILDAVKLEFPHHWSKIHAGRDALRHPADQCLALKDTACSLVDVVQLGGLVSACGAREGCFNISGFDQSLCLVLKCADIFRMQSIPEKCISCLFFEAPLPLAEVLQTCVTQLPVHNRVNEPGLLVLSKQRLSRVTYTEFFPGRRMAVERGYVEAELDDGKLAVCTHLTSIFPYYVEFDLPFNSYLEQANAEITQLGTAYSGRRHVLLGDFNTGPVVNDKPGEKNLTGEFPSNYHRLLSFGYRAPYMEFDGRCTFCNANPLTLGFSNNVIDQVLVQPPDSFSIPLAERAFDQVDPYISDHYGSRADVCDP